MGRILAFFRSLDWLVMLPVCLLLLLGLSELYSISSGQGGVLFQKQLVVVIGALILLLAVAMIDYYTWHSYAYYVYLFSLFLLVLVLFLGVEINSTKGWFNLVIMTFQPVELAKAAVIIALARYFSNANFSAHPWRVTAYSFGIVMLPVGLTMLQPDLGSSLVLLGIWALMLVAGLPKKYLVYLVLTGMLVCGLSWQFLATYQQDRILSVFTGRSGNLVSDYNVNQAIIAIGSGQWFGRGLGFGSQSQLRFLPEAKTDFIFSVVSEELGFLGVALVLTCFGVIFARFLYNLPNIKDNFGIFFLFGLLDLIFIQMFINIGMNLGLLPVVGITLPFLSYGGSSLLIDLLLVGIAQNILIRVKIKNY